MICSLLIDVTVSEVRIPAWWRERGRGCKWTTRRQHHVVWNRRRRRYHIPCPFQLIPKITWKNIIGSAWVYYCIWERKRRADIVSEGSLSAHCTHYLVLESWTYYNSAERFSTLRQPQPFPTSATSNVVNLYMFLYYIVFGLPTKHLGKV